MALLLNRVSVSSRSHGGFADPLVCVAAGDARSLIDCASGITAVMFVLLAPSVCASQPTWCVLPLTLSGGFETDVLAVRVFCVLQWVPSRMCVRVRVVDALACLLLMQATSEKQTKRTNSSRASAIQTSNARCQLSAHASNKVSRVRNRAHPLGAAMSGRPCSAAPIVFLVLYGLARLHA